MIIKNMLRTSCFSHFLYKCVTPDMTSKNKAPSLTEFWKVSDDKPGYFFKWPKCKPVPTLIPVPNVARNFQVKDVHITKCRFEYILPKFTSKLFP